MQCSVCHMLSNLPRRCRLPAPSPHSLFPCLHLCPGLAGAPGPSDSLCSLPLLPILMDNRPGAQLVEEVRYNGGSCPDPCSPGGSHQLVWEEGVTCRCTTTTTHSALGPHSLSAHSLGNCSASLLEAPQAAIFTNACPAPTPLLHLRKPATYCLSLLCLQMWSLVCPLLPRAFHARLPFVQQVPSLEGSSQGHVTVGLCDG